MFWTTVPDCGCRMAEGSFSEDRLNSSVTNCNLSLYTLALNVRRYVPIIYTVGSSCHRQVVVSDSGSPTRSSTASLFVVVSPTGMYSGPRPPLATLPTIDVLSRRDAVGVGTEPAPSRLELLPIGEWRWPGVIVGCLAVAVIILAAFIIGISGCAARQRRHRKEKQRHRSSELCSSLNGNGRSVGAGFRTSVAMDTLERKRKNASVAEVDGMEREEEEEGEPRSPGSRSSRQRQHFDVGGDLTTFTSSSVSDMSHHSLHFEL